MKFEKGDKVKVVISGDIDSISALYKASRLGWGGDGMAEVATKQKVGVVISDWENHTAYTVKFEDNDQLEQGIGYWIFFPEHLQLVDELFAIDMANTEQQKFEEAIEAAKDASALIFMARRLQDDDPRVTEYVNLSAKICAKYEHMRPKFADVYENIKKKYADL